MAINKNKSIAAAQKFIQKGQLDKAIQEYLRVVQEEPQDVRTWLKIGDLYAKKGARSDATQTYIKVAEFYSQQGFYLKAVAVYKQILKLDPSLYVVNLKLAELYQQLGLVADALGQFELVAAHHQRAGQEQDAIDVLRRAAELDPQNVASQIKLAELYSKEGSNELAVSGFRRACELLRQQERHDDYLKVGERLLFHKTDDVGVARHMAQLYLSRRDTKRALAKIQLCIKHDARDTEALQLLAGTFRELGQVPKTVSVYKEIARIFQEQGKVVDRQEVYRRVLELAPEDTEAREALGQARAPARRSAPPEPSPPVRPSTPAPASRLVVPIPALGRVATPIAVEPDPFDGSSGSFDGVSETDLVSDEVEPYEEPVSVQASMVDSAEIIEDYSETDGVRLDERLEDPEPFGDVSPGAGAEHEIARVLTETEVFIKYGLREKAIEHLTRVFEIDPGHFEAREKLKDLYIETGQEQSAIDELWKLVELFAPTQPQGAAYYLREIVTLSPHNHRALDLLAEMGHTPESLGLTESLGDGGSLGGEPLVDSEPLVEGEQLGGGASLGLSDAVDQTQDLSDVSDISEVSEVSVAEVPTRDHDHQSQSVMRLAMDAPFAFGEQPSAQRRDDAFDLDDPDLLGDSASPELTPPTGRLTDLSRDVGDDSRAGRPTVEIHEEPDRARGGKVIQFPSAGSGTSPTIDAPPPGTMGLGLEVEEGLEEAEFFLAQGLVDEARVILDELERTHPGNAIIRERLVELREAAGETGEADPLDESFELAAKLAEELGAGPAPATEGGEMLDVEQVFEQFKQGVDAEVGIEDSDTHFDLGIAYKEMGLLDDAIHEFQVSMRNTAKECICNTMIGLCYLEKGAYSEAIGAFKKGLYVEQKTEREELGLYFELGNAYELLNDAREAAYYYQKVLKRDPDFRDVKGKIRALTQPRSGAAKPAVHEDDVDKAFDDLLSSRK